MIDRLLARFMVLPQKRSKRVYKYPILYLLISEVPDDLRQLLMSLAEQGEVVEIEIKKVIRDTVKASKRVRGLRRSEASEKDS